MAKKKRPNIEFHSLLDGIKNIKKRNERFLELSNEGKRLEIAWDCLKLIKLGKVRANGTKVGYWDDKLHNATNYICAEDVQKVVQQIEECKVCARGGIMLSQIRLGNLISGYDPYRDEGTKENLEGFSIEDMRKMENEYEYNLYDHPYFSGTNEKLMNIMCNILVNGNFNPRDKKDYLI